MLKKTDSLAWYMGLFGNIPHDVHKMGAEGELGIHILV